MRTIYTYFLLGLLVFFSITANAQSQSTSLSVKQNSVEVKGDQFYVDFDIIVNRLAIKSNQGIVLTPVLQGNNRQKTFPKVILNGRNQAISYDRMIGNGLYDSLYFIARADRKSTMIIPYQMVVPFEPWMKNSTFLVQADVCGCGRITQNVYNMTVARNITSSVPILNTTPAISQDSMTAVLYFPEGEAVILPDYGMNRECITKIHSLLSNSEIITSIAIVGAASPKGSYDFNIKLSKDRALSISSYLQNHYNLSTKISRTDWVGEDWEMLLQLIDQSDMQSKQQASEIIKNTNSSSERKIDLKKLESGELYQYLQTHFFPQLRRAICTIYYKTNQ